MNYDKEWDVIVVGAGPGGSVCSKEFSKKGLKTLMIDRKQQIGPPKRCGEGLSMRWFEITDMKPNPRWATQEMNGAIIISPKGKKITIQNNVSKGYILERSQWEKDLAERSIRAGTKVMLKALVTDVIKEGDYVVGVKVQRDGQEEEYKAKIVVAADGIDSGVTRKVGLSMTLPLNECDAGYQYEMANMPMMDEHKMELYFGHEVAPRGYVWVFPKGKDVANVGIGVSGKDSNTAKYYLDRWIENNKERFEKASITEINAGVIPVTSPIKKFTANGFMAIGDAARMVNPIHGGGMGSTMEAGIMAAEIGAEAIAKGNVSDEELSKYQKKWEDVRGKEFKNILKVRHIFEKLNDEQMEIIASSIDDPDLLVDLGHGKNLVSLAKIIMKAGPAAAKLAASILLSGE